MKKLLILLSHKAIYALSSLGSAIAQLPVVSGLDNSSKQKYLQIASFITGALLLLTTTVISQVTDDYQTRGSGNWNGTTTWQRYNGTAWVNIATGPTSSNRIITILNTHTITVTADVTVDQVIINAGGSVIVNSPRTLTVANGSGTDLTINGSLTNNGTVTLAGVLTSGGTITNGGTITSNNTFTTSGSVSNSGTITFNNAVTNSGTFTNPGTVTFSSSVANSGTLTSSGTITNGNTFTNTGTLTNSGTITNNSTLTNNGTATINGILNNTNTVNGSNAYSFASGSQYIHARNGGTIPTGTWNSNSTCLITGITGTNPSGLSQSFGNFTWNCTGQSSDRNLSGNLTTVTGNFQIASTGSGGDLLYLTNGTSLTTNIGGNFIITGGDLLLTSSSSTDVTVTVTGNFSQSGGSINFSDAGNIGVLTMSVTGDFTQTGGDFDFASGGANVPRTPALNVGGNFSQSGSATLQTSTNDTDITNGTITFNKNGAQTFSIATQSNFLYVNFIVGSSSTLELNSNITLSSISTNNWAGNFTVNSGATLNAKTYLVLSSSGSSGGLNNDFILNSGANVMTANTNGLQSGTIGTVSTSIANRTFSSGANYTYNGSAIQNSGTFTTSPVANQVNNLTVNNTGGSTGVTLQQTIAIAGTCYFTAGRITSSTTYLLIFNDNAIASGANNNVSNPSYVNGPVRKIGNDAFTFPVGKSNVGYMLCGISAPASATDAFTAEYRRNSATALGNCTATGLYRVSACEYWQLDRTTGSSSVNVTLSWSGLSPCNASAYVNSLSSLVVAHFNGTAWDAYGNNGGTTGNGAAGTVTWNNVSTFSPFSLGSTDAVANPLPIKFSEVKAYKVNGGNKIEWKNGTEENMERYEVERSANGTVFSSIISVTPKSNNGLEQAYSTIDENTLNGTNFYRIKGIEIDGTFIYSTIVKVVAETGNKDFISVYPNPVTANQFTIQLNNYPRGNYSLQLISANGQRLIMKSLQHAGGSASISMERPEAAQTGIYILQVTGENKTENIKLVIK